MRQVNVPHGGSRLAEVWSSELEPLDLANNRWMEVTCGSFLFNVVVQTTGLTGQPLGNRLVQYPVHSKS